MSKPSCPACDCEMLIRAMGMVAENKQREYQGDAMAYVEDDFEKLLEHPPEPAQDEWVTAMQANSTEPPKELHGDMLFDPRGYDPKPEPVDLAKEIDKLGDTLNNLAEDYNSLLLASHTLKEGQSDGC